MLESVNFLAYGVDDFLSKLGKAKEFECDFGLFLEKVILNFAGILNFLLLFILVSVNSCYGTV